MLQQVQHASCGNRTVRHAIGSALDLHDRDPSVERPLAAEAMLAPANRVSAVLDD